MPAQGTPRPQRGTRAEGRPAPTRDDEVIGTMRAELARCATRATEKSEVLQSIGARALDLAGDIHRGASLAGLRATAHEMQGLILHALVVAAELQGEACRLDTLATLRCAMESAPDEDLVGNKR